MDKVHGYRVRVLELLLELGPELDPTGTLKPLLFPHAISSSTASTVTTILQSPIQYLQYLYARTYM